jgi:hypothetical protein
VVSYFCYQLSKEQCSKAAGIAVEGRSSMETHLPFTILPQPTITTCGPTCLHAIYRFHEDHVSLKKVIAEVPSLETGGTLAAYLGCHALRRGYSATIYTLDLAMFDPSWFGGAEAADINLRAKLESQAKVKNGSTFEKATRAFLEFLDLGGRIRFRDLNPSLIRKYLKRGIPILTGLSATYLHRTAREKGIDGCYDDIAGTSSGHFVVLCGYDPKEKLVAIADPLRPNPIAKSHYYKVRIDRVICSILLGILTSDANLLIIEKKDAMPCQT